MVIPATTGNAAPDWVPQVQRPDYHLTPSAPLWASVNECIAGPPILSIHPGLEVGIVLAGQEQTQLEGCLIRGDVGDVWLCAMSEPHRFRIVHAGTVNLVLVFLPSFLGEEMLGDLAWLRLFAARPVDRPRVASTETRQKVMSIAQVLRQEIEDKREGWECAVRIELLRLLFYLSRGWRCPSSPRARGGAYTGNLSRIMPALTLLQAPGPERVSREEAAQACGLGRSRFTTLFRELMGVSFKTFRRRARIMFAADMLLTSSLSLDSIAEQAGFADASHLHHSFVEQYNCTPGQYRRQGQSDRSLPR
ncbi:MAG: AraC family transcriptional regulator [Armatimonadetes bacterium]|nr:AraC family transcriptional regulator [Armatimonadota bacterium]